MNGQQVNKKRLSLAYHTAVSKITVLYILKYKF